MKHFAVANNIFLTFGTHGVKQRVVRHTICLYESDEDSFFANFCSVNMVGRPWGFPCRENDHSLAFYEPGDILKEKDD